MIGVAALNLGFGGEDGGGIYHSIYDDFLLVHAFQRYGFLCTARRPGAGGGGPRSCAWPTLICCRSNTGIFSDAIET